LTQSNPKPGLFRSRKFYVGIVLVAALVLSSWYAASQYLQQLYPTNSTSSQTNASINVLFNYGNGTAIWSNSTMVPKGSSFYNTTVALTNNRLEAKYYESFHEHLVSSINGVTNFKNGATSYWQIWIYCTRDRAWMYSSWGADALKPTSQGLSIDNSVGHQVIMSSNALAWSYQASSDNPPVLGATKVDLCSS
jgi:hypothetical protein